MPHDQTTHELYAGYTVSDVIIVMNEHGTAIPV